MAKMLVTGCAGFIGSALVNELLNRGHTVVGTDIKWIDRERTDHLINLWNKPDKDFTFHLVDLRDFERVFEYLFQQYDYIFHLAANMGGIGYITQPLHEIMYDNLQIDLNMLRLATIMQFRPIFLYTSSACVYPQNLQKDPISIVVPKHPSDYRLSEKMALPADPDSYYGWEKLTMEKLLQLYHQSTGLDIRIARLHNIYGPGIDYEEPRSKAIGALCRKTIRYPKEEFTIWGDGLQSRSFCYISDCVEALLLLAESDYIDPINIGSDRRITIFDLATMIKDISDRHIVTKCLEPDKPQGVRHRNADIRLAREVLGWYPKISLETGVKLTYKWIQRMENDFR